MSAVEVRRDTPPGCELSPEEILDRARSSFRAGFVGLCADRRAGLTAIYAFCRGVDDAADEAPDAATGKAHLAFWRDELHAAEQGRAATPTGRALGVAMARFGARAEPLDALIDGCAMDLEPLAFATEQDLRLYCDRVASAVGRACLPVFDVAGAEATRFADALGQALQFTNILRDLRSDADTGRVYVPSIWLADCGVERGWLDGTGPDEVYREDGPIARLSARFVEQARAEFDLARIALAAMPRRARRRLVPARIMGAVYEELLRRLSRRGGELRGESVRVSKARKLWLALTVLLGVRA